MTAAHPRCSILQADADKQLLNSTHDVTYGCLVQMGFMLAGDGVPRLGVWHPLQTKLVQQLCDLHLMFTRSCRLVPELLVSTY